MRTLRGLRRQCGSFTSVLASPSQPLSSWTSVPFLLPTPLRYTPFIPSSLGGTSRRTGSALPFRSLEHILLTNAFLTTPNPHLLRIPFLFLLSIAPASWIPRPQARRHGPHRNSPRPRRHEGDADAEACAEGFTEGRLVVHLPR